MKTSTRRKIGLAINVGFWLLIFFVILYLLVESQAVEEGGKTAVMAILLFFTGLSMPVLLEAITHGKVMTSKLLDVSDAGEEVYTFLVAVVAQLFWSVIFALSFNDLIPPFSLLDNPLDAFTLFTAQSLGEDLIFGTASYASWRVTKNLFLALVPSAAGFALMHSVSLLGVPLYQSPQAFAANISLFLSLFMTQTTKSYAVVKLKNVIGSGMGHAFTNWLISGAGYAVIKMALLRVGGV